MNNPADIEVWSRDEKNFYDFGDFLDMALDDLETGHVVYRGVQVMRDAAYFVCRPSDLLVEEMQERAWDEADEFAEGWPNLPDAKWSELDALVTEWLNKNVPVTFWTVRDVKPVTVTEEMLAEWREPTPGVATDAPIKAAMEACRPILARLKHQDGDEEAARALDMVAAALGVRACPSCGARSQCDAENLCHGETCPLPDTGDDFDAALGAAGVATTTATDDLLETLEDMARQHCLTNGNATSSGALSTNAYVLRLLAKAGRFRIARESGRMVIGYWPENEPESGAGVATDQQENKHG